MTANPNAVEGIRRFDVSGTHAFPDPDGKWVRYADVVQLLAEVEALRSRIEWCERMEKANDTICRWKGHLTEHLILAGVKFPENYDESEMWALDQYRRIVQSEVSTRAETAEAAQLEEYFTNRSDVLDGDYGVPAPNEKMRMLQHVQFIREELPDWKTSVLVDISYNGRTITRYIPRKWIGLADAQITSGE